MIISIRGTHGSGKSTAVKELIAVGNGQPIMGALRNKPEAYRLDIEGVREPVYVLGPYTTACGGCDAVQPYDLILELLSKYAGQGHIVFEGALVSSSHGRVGDYMDQFGPQAVMAYMATPIDECLARIRKRREDRGDYRTLNTKNTEGKYRSVVRHRGKVESAGIQRVVELRADNASGDLLKLLRGQL